MGGLNIRIKIMVAAHKEFPMPRDKQLYLPVLVGAEKNWNKCIVGYQRDDEGENISKKNSNYNELTAIYWAWKNLKDTDAIGLVHYRRFLVNSSSSKKIITGDRVEQLLSDFDVIVPKRRKYYIESNYSHYIHAHHREPLDILRRVIKKQDYRYLMAFDKVMRADSAHMFNMFVMKRKLFNEYASWLFSLLSEVEKRVDISEYDQQEARVFGYLSEILLDVWLETNKISYVEVPWKQIGKRHLFKKAIRFLGRKIGLGKFNYHI